MIEFLRRIFFPNRYNGYCYECDWATICRSQDDARYAAFEHMRLTGHPTMSEYGRPRSLAERRTGLPR